MSITSTSIQLPAHVVADRIRNLIPGDYMHLNSKFMRIDETQDVQESCLGYPGIRNIRFEGYGELAFMQFRADDIVLAVKASQGGPS